VGAQSTSTTKANVAAPLIRAEVLGARRRPTPKDTTYPKLKGSIGRSPAQGDGNALGDQHHLVRDVAELPARLALLIHQLLLHLSDGLLPYPKRIVGTNATLAHGTKWTRTESLELDA